MPTIHISANKEEIAKTVIMPGDPKRAEYIAKNFLTEYKLVNTTRGMNAYTGYYKDKLITIFASGMGNPSIGIYSYELFKYYGVDNIIRVGSVGGYQKSLNLNDVILVETSYSDSSYAKVQYEYNENYLNSSKEINEKILEATKEKEISIINGNIFCSDVFYAKNENYEEKIEKYNALGVEMETFALFSNAKYLNKNASCLLTVSNLFFSEKELTSEEREKKLNTMIELSLEAALKL